MYFVIFWYRLKRQKERLLTNLLKNVSKKKKLSYHLGVILASQLWLEIWLVVFHLNQNFHIVDSKIKIFNLKRILWWKIGIYLCIWNWIPKFSSCWSKSSSFHVLLLFETPDQICMFKFYWLDAKLKGKYLIKNYILLFALSTHLIYNS